MICPVCEKREVQYIKHKLCTACYLRLRRNGLITTGKRDGEPKQHLLPVTMRHVAERSFIEAFFDHNDWTPQPGSFTLKDGTRYNPDFYDHRRGVFIEVVGTRQAYHANKDKYQQFREQYSAIPFEIRWANGDLHDETTRAYHKKNFTQEG